MKPKQRTFTVAKRATLEALAKRLIQKEAVDREALAKRIADTGAA